MERLVRLLRGAHQLVRRRHAGREVQPEALAYGLRLLLNTPALGIAMLVAFCFRTQLVHILQGPLKAIDPKLLQTYAQMLLTRGVEGFITTDTSLTEKLALPTVAVAGHQRVEGLTNIILDHTRAAHLALEHLRDLGHQEIAFIKGQTMSSDSTVRWNAICEVAEQLGIRIRPELTIQLEGFDSTPGIGYTFTKQLLARKHSFTALFAYNDIAAIGAIWAFYEAGLRVPEDISVVGFDDIPGAAYANTLALCRPPLRR